MYLSFLFSIFNLTVLILGLDSIDTLWLRQQVKTLPHPQRAPLSGQAPSELLWTIPSHHSGSRGCTASTWGSQVLLKSPKSDSFSPLPGCADFYDLCLWTVSIEIYSVIQSMRHCIFGVLL